MGRSREEAASAVVNNDLYVLGGFVDDQRALSTDRLSNTGGWTFGPDLPEARYTLHNNQLFSSSSSFVIMVLLVYGKSVSLLPLSASRSRFCAVALTGLSALAIIGGETDEALATSEMKVYNTTTEEVRLSVNDVMIWV